MRKPSIFLPDVLLLLLADLAQWEQLYLKLHILRVQNPFVRATGSRWFRCAAYCKCWPGQNVA